VAGGAGLLLLYPNQGGQAGTRREAEPVVAAPAEMPQPRWQAAPPTRAEAAAALARVYKKALVVDGAVLGGDFDGDGSPDLLAVVRPQRGALPTLNAELAHWIVQDATEWPRTSRPKIAAGDRLLAVLHGYGPQGWRDEAAQQTYLVTRAAGEGLEVQPATRLVAAMHLPAREIYGDVVRERVGGAEGYLFWTGATYQWRSDAALVSSHDAVTGRRVSPHGPQR
jgi:hypothetical protein